MFNFIKPKRPVSTVFIHCSALDSKGDKRYIGKALVETIKSWHRARGFATVGYQILIDELGGINLGRSMESIPAAQKGHNTGSIAICLHGLKYFNEAQFKSLREVCHAINKAYGGRLQFRGHREVEPNKTCPVFDYAKVLGLNKFKQIPLK